MQVPYRVFWYDLHIAPLENDTKTGRGLMACRLNAYTSQMANRRNQTRWKLSFRARQHAYTKGVRIQSWSTLWWAGLPKFPRACQVFWSTHGGDTWCHDKRVATRGRVDMPLPIQTPRSTTLKGLHYTVLRPGEIPATEAHEVSLFDQTPIWKGWHNVDPICPYYCNV